MPKLVRVDLAQTELGAVADQPFVGIDGNDVHRLADNVFRHVWRRDLLPCDVRTAVRTDGVVKQPLLEAL